MNRTLALALALAVAVPALATRWVPLEPGRPETPAGFRVVTDNSRRTVVELTIAGFYAEDVSAGGATWQRLTLGMPGGGALTDVGAPELPVVARFLQVPDDRAVTVTVKELEEVVLPGWRVYPAQPAQVEGEAAPAFVVDDKRYAEDALFPAASERSSEPMIMRDLRLVQLVLQPARCNPVTGELRVAKRLVVELAYEGRGDANVKTRRGRSWSRAFLPFYERLVANFDGPPVRPEDGSYLVITADAFAGAVEPFAAWKRQKGWRTVVRTVTDIGGNDSAHITAAIRDAYDNWPCPPDYILLVGDAPNGLRCCHHSSGAASDLPYSCLEGGDILADVMLGRVAVETETEARTVLNKLCRFEKEPYMGNTDWFGKACAVAAYESSPRFWSVVIRIRDYVMGNPIAQFDTLFERWGLNTRQGLTDSLELGRSWMLYRGHGMKTGWHNMSPSWSNSDVFALRNDGMTPIVIGPTCDAGDFDYAEMCQAEAWLRAGTPDTVRGGTGYFGASEPSYSGYNDTLAFGAFKGYTDSTMFTFGQSTQYGKLLMLESYPLPDNISEQEIWMFNNIGEPELNLWSAAPAMPTVNHPATVIIGQFPFTVEVSAADAPVENALVCVMSRADTTIYHVGHTDAAGQVQFTLNATLPGDSILVTVTGRNLHPYLGAAMTISPNAAYVTHLRHAVSDSAGGNNDGVVNPGEVIDLSMWVKNWGSLPANSVTGILRTADPAIAITDSTESFGTVGAGDSAYRAGAYRFGVGHGCGNGYALRFDLACRDASDSVWVSGFNLTVGTAVLAYAGCEVDDCPPGGNGDGKLDPGETATLRAVLHNSGLGHGYDVRAVLRSGDPRFHVTDTLGEWGTIPADSSGANSGDPFQVTADDSLPMETAVPCTLDVTAEGWSASLPLTIIVGEIRSIDPVPDNAEPTKYWAYDEGDSNYSQAPTFEWVDIAGVGTRLAITSDDQTVQVTLPSGFGPFVFYGRISTQLSVCGNGWVGPGYTTRTAYSNAGLPSNSQPTMVALAWDDLYPPTSNGVWWYHDADNHRFIVQYDSMCYYSSRTTFDWFQLIIYDTTMAAPDGNSVFTVQYLTANGYSSCTVGSNDSVQTLGIQCLLDGSYHRGTMPLAPGRAICYTTEGPTTAVGEPVAPAALARRALAVVPSPFTGRAQVHWQLARDGDAALVVYDAAGRSVRVLHRGAARAGAHVAVWDGTDDRGREVARGVYFVRLDTPGRTVRVKTILAR